MWCLILPLVFLNVFYLLVTQCKCVHIQARIIGGTYCDLRYPETNYNFMVSLRTYDEDFDFYEHFCGGTLITEYWILTAGHCSKPKPVYAVEAYKIDEIEYTGLATKVSARIPHPKFDNKTNNNDIALMLLVSPMRKSDKIGYVKLPFCSNPTLDLSKVIEDKCTVMGWGQTTKDEHGKWFPLRLECLDLNLINLNQCRREHDQHNRNKTVFDHNICTEASNHLDFWKGDSGGPLLCDGIQYGIMSWGYGAQGYPSVYTRVDNYLNFIRENVCKAPGA